VMVGSAHPTVYLSDYRLIGVIMARWVPAEGAVFSATVGVY